MAADTRRHIRTRHSDGSQEPAQAPTQVEPRSWWRALKRTPPRIKALNISLLAAGVAFWAMLSVFPALLAVVTLYGLVSDPADVTEQVGNAVSALSDDAQGVITGTLEQVAADKSLSIGLLISLVTLLWSTSSGMHNLMTALTTAFEQEETRGFVKLRARALLLSIIALVMAVIVIGIVGVVPRLLDSLLDNTVLRVLLQVLGVVVLLVLVVAALSALYRFGPANVPAGWRWASAGAVVAAMVWAVGTAAFAVYANNFGSYNKVYGTLAGLVIFMLWLYLSSFVVLLGALVNAEGQREVKGDAPSEPEGVDRDIVRSPQHPT